MTLSSGVELGKLAKVFGMWLLFFITLLLFSRPVPKRLCKGACIDPFAVANVSPDLGWDEPIFPSIEAVCSNRGLWSKLLFTSLAQSSQLRPGRSREPSKKERDLECA